HRWFHFLNDLSDEDRIEEGEPLGGLEFAGEVGAIKRSLVYRYRFPEQDHEVKVGGDVRAQDGSNPGEVVALDDAARTIDFKHGKVDDPSAVRAVLPYDRINPGELQASIERIATWAAGHAIAGPGPYRAARDLLLREPPRAGQAAGGPILAAGGDVVEAAVAAALALDESYLAIQGPPGSGKTYIGARIAIALASMGFRVGVTANSHKVIGHLLGEIEAVAEREGWHAPRIGQKTDTEGRVAFEKATPLKTNKDVENGLLERELDVVGSTAWTWSRPEFAGLLDVLIIDEAGQMSLATAVAVSPAASSLVLLGDPQQLDQPLQGSHPPGAERSALAHLLDESATMAPELGIFLERTRRLHPSICAFTSEAFYEGRLAPIDGLELQVLTAPEHSDLAGAGGRLLLVPHAGNTNDAPEEAAVVARVVNALASGGWSWTTDQGQVRRLGLDDILVVTPYNAHVGLLEDRLPSARIGTVDKFQGQQAPVSIYSMATSTQADAPRGMEFLYSLNRLNVATSRARCVTLVVASPELLRVRAKTPRQMQLANG
ncbi:MAG TPA: ATP-binding protein, partial [Candidatus Limnocylindrales bacterium]